MPHSPHLEREKCEQKKDGKTRCFSMFFFRSRVANLLRGDVERDGPKVHLLVGLDTGQHEKETCAVESNYEFIGGQRGKKSDSVDIFAAAFRLPPAPIYDYEKRMDG